MSRTLGNLKTSYGDSQWQIIEFYKQRIAEFW